MFEITVVKYHSNPDSEYIGRGSVLGNKHPITSTQTREMVCDLYEKEFYERLRTDDGHYGNNSDFVNELRRLYRKGKEQGYLKLGCFCKNNNQDKTRCHADTLKSFFDQNQDSMIDYE